MELQVWCAPADGEPGAGTFRSYVAQIVQHAVAPYPDVFVVAVQGFLERMPTVGLPLLEAFFQDPVSLSDPVAIVARHYLGLLRSEASSSGSSLAPVAVAVLTELLNGFRRLVGRPLECSDPRTAVLAFLALVALCDLRHQRRMCAESLASLLTLESRAPDGPEARFWAGCFFTLLEFTHSLQSGGVSAIAARGHQVAATAPSSPGSGSPYMASST